MSRSWLVSLTLLAAVAASAGCAGGAPRPTAELARAQVMIEQAERNRAQQYAAADLDRARDKLRGASDAADEKENEQARRLAVEAAADAELALARSIKVQAESSAQEISASVETLRREAQREENRQ